MVKSGISFTNRDVTMYPCITLKPGKDASARYRHPWIFSGAIDQIKSVIEHGSLVAVTSHSGDFLGVGTYSANSSIAVRIFDYTSTPIDQSWFETKLRSADQTRLLLGYGPDTATTGYRIIFSEADNIPGLILDRYAGVYVMQISTAGLDRQKSILIEAIKAVFEPDTIIERSDLPVRKQENLPDVIACHHGEPPELVEFTEHGIKFLSDPVNGQKTGFFLDQKDLRRELVSLSKDKKILNLFSYTGANAAVALQNGASHVTNIDSSDPALKFAKKLFKLYELDSAVYKNITADVFDWLSAAPSEKYDLIILDPPALIKSQDDTISGKKAYHFLNRTACQLLNPGGIFITSSCSRFLSETDFAFILRQASVQASVNLRLLKTVYQSADHPQSLYFPHSLYLKTFICQQV
ncbi:MAG: hypothetical protein ACD_40C00108G0004 [uncultured bacterium]|nr:MAG: hypothetical protein ACD_40C00108G0004 [uncultured bacterium]